MVHLYEAENDKGSEGLPYLLKEAPRRLLDFSSLKYGTYSKNCTNYGIIIFLFIRLTEFNSLGFNYTRTAVLIFS